MKNKIIAYDTETYPFWQTGKATKDIVPRLVCLSWSDGETTELLERARAIPLFRSWLEDTESNLTLVGLNLAFDIAVMARALQEEYPEDFEFDLWPKLYAVTKWDIGVETKLLDIALGGMFLRGRYSLAALVKRWLGEEMGGKKALGLGPDVWRSRYNELEGRHTDDYPAAAHHYALNDADVTWRVFAALQKAHNPNRGAVPIRSQYACDLHLMSCWGLMIDGRWVRAIKAHYEAEFLKYETTLSTPSVEIDGEIVAIIQDGVKKTKVVRHIVQMAWDSIGEPPILTDGGKSGKKQIKTDGATIKALERKGVEEPLFQSYSRYNRAQKFLSTYVEPLMDAEDGPICPRYNETVDSGRTSSSEPNVQNMPSRINANDKKSLESWKDVLEGDPESGDELEPIDRLLQGFVTGPDIRGAFIPRPGRVFVAADYTAAEMAGLAQVCRNLFGELGTLGKAINNKMDLHIYVAAFVMGISYEECYTRYEDKDPAVAEQRMVAKIANFGFAGGASPQTFIDYAAGFGVMIDLYTAERLKAAWLDAWTEMKPYFQHISRQQTARGTFHIEQHGPMRKAHGWRLRVTSRYTQAANTLFQGIVADGALYAIHLVVKACYTEPESPLYGCRPLLFIHDELVIEAPEDKAQEAADELSRLMILGMKRFLPDIDVIAEPSILTDRWSK